MTDEFLNSLATCYPFLLNPTNRTHVYHRGSLILIALHCFFTLYPWSLFMSLHLFCEALYMFSALHRFAICFYLVIYWYAHEIVTRQVAIMRVWNT